MSGNLRLIVSTALLSGALLVGCGGGDANTAVVPESGSAVTPPPATPVATNPETPAPSAPTTPPVTSPPAPAEPVNPAPTPGVEAPVPPAASTGVATLNWDAPTEFTDGSALPATEVGGYRVFHGETAETLSAVAEVDSLATTLTVKDLVAGTHYFAVAAISVTGEDGEMSPVLAKNVL